MTSRRIALTAAVALLLSLTPPIAMAQASAPAAAPAAPPAAPIGPRLMTPAESRRNASLSSDLRPERPVAPQLSIPFGKAPPATPNAAPRSPARGTVAASTGSIDDAAARCEARADARLRATCRDKL